MFAFKYILANFEKKMATIAVFQLIVYLIFARTLSLPVLYPQFPTFMVKQTIRTGWTKMPLEGVQICACAHSVG